MIAVQVKEEDLKGFLRYVYRLERIAKQEGYDKICILKSQRVFGALQEPRQQTITITVKGGVVTDVKGLPQNWTYTLQDLDV